MIKSRIGVWLIGALGSIATTVLLGALALRKGLIDSTGMITAADPFVGLDLVPADALEFGGCDIRQGKLRDAVHQAARDSRCLDPVQLDVLESDLVTIEREIRQGTIRNCGQAIGNLAGSKFRSTVSLRQEIDQFSSWIDEFRFKRGVDRVVVVNVASTEPPVELRACHEDLPKFEDCLDHDENEVVRASTIYAYAAIQSGCPYINFTPSNGALFPAMVQLAERNRVPVMGNDGKTGETLVKSALAPMFLCRNLEVLSWEGLNILGNMDGHILDNPNNRESKIQTKDRVLSGILGYTPHSEVQINYVPSLGDQKTAWDFIHFRGFLGSKMSLQFVWQGYDSLLAAPLVLDLVRWAEFAHRRNEAGLMRHLACYFKDPLGVDEHRLHAQFQMLLDYAEQARTGPKGSEIKP